MLNLFNVERKAETAAKDWCFNIFLLSSFSSGESRTFFLHRFFSPLLSEEFHSLLALPQGFITAPALLTYTLLLWTDAGARIWLLHLRTRSIGSSPLLPGHVNWMWRNANSFSKLVGNDNNDFRHSGASSEKRNKRCKSNWNSMLALNWSNRLDFHDSVCSCSVRLNIWS